MFEGIVIGLIFSSLTIIGSESLDKSEGVKKTGDKFCVLVHEKQEDKMKIEILEKCEK